MLSINGCNITADSGSPINPYVSTVSNSDAEVTPPPPLDDLALLILLNGIELELFMHRAN